MFSSMNKTLTSTGDQNYSYTHTKKNALSTQWEKINGQMSCKD